MIINYNSSFSDQLLDDRHGSRNSATEERVCKGSRPAYSTRSGRTPSGAGIRISALKGKPRKRLDPPESPALLPAEDNAEHVAEFGERHVIAGRDQADDHRAHLAKGS